MTADEGNAEGNAENQWPVPPPWMWGCADCVHLYRTMKRVQDETNERRGTGERGVDDDPMDSTIGTRIRLAHHLVADHHEDLPDWLPACERCAWHRRILARSPDEQPGDAAVLVADEHRALHLFVPPRSLGLM
ncbi:hypothetical protein [Embleya sp. AB8]|uniref:hypothetical protein n=1 Tax=Embleya sp. AB8 TaxID=3156304 RepID=UPI003C742B7A